MTDPGPSPKRRWSFSLPEESSPTELGPYRILGSLGKGAQGEVYRALDPDAGREVALKVLRSQSDTALARFQREAEATASLNHPGIVRVHAAGQDGDASYLVYELIEDARTLEDAFEGSPSHQEVATWILEAAEAVGSAHAAGIVHRDLKPANLLLDGSGTLRVADFGLAQLAEGKRLTVTRAAVGTPLYMSPEQIRAERNIGPPADVWGLGVVLYEGLCGELPFLGPNMAMLGAQILGGSVEAPSAHDPTIPHALEKVCLRCLKLDPKDRYADGAELALSLEEAMRPARSGLLAGGPALALAAVLLVASLSLALALALPGASGPEATRPLVEDPASFLAALRAKDWTRAEALVPRARDPELWRLRLLAERGASPAELELGLHAAFPGSQRDSSRALSIAALSSARAAFLRGEAILPALREAESQGLAAPWRRIALAEVLLCSRRPLEALDVLEGSVPEGDAGADPSEAQTPRDAVPLSWCPEGTLRAALLDLLERTPGRIDWSQLPQIWHDAAADWLLSEARDSLAWVTRARERSHLPQAPTDPTERARRCLVGAASIQDSAERRLLHASLDPLSLAEAEALPPLVDEGSDEAAAIRLAIQGRLKADSLTRAEAPRAQALLRRIEANDRSRDAWGKRRRAAQASDWLRGRVALIAGAPEEAFKALHRADPLGHHPDVAQDRARAADLLPDPALQAEAKAQLEALGGAHRAQAEARVRELRDVHREGAIPLALIKATIALDPLNPLTHHTTVVSAFQIGDLPPEDLILIAEDWPAFTSVLHRQFFERCRPLPHTARLARNMLPLLEKRASPTGLWILDGLVAEADGASAGAARLLLDRAPPREHAPGTLAPRLTRAFLAIRAGYLTTAKAELAWVDSVSPDNSLAYFYRSLLLAKEGSPAASVCQTLEAAFDAMFRTHALPTWSPGDYPELAPYFKAPQGALRRLLKRRGWYSVDRKK